jgi:hypothetical protein
MIFSMLNIDYVYFACEMLFDYIEYGIWCE